MYINATKKEWFAEANAENAVCCYEIDCTTRQKRGDL